MRVRTFLLAQYAVVNNQTKNVSLTEIFEALTFTGQFILANFAAYVQLEPQYSGDVALQVVVRDSMGTQLGSSGVTTGSVNQSEGLVVFTSMMMAPIVFPGPGIYTVALIVNGQELARRPLGIVMAGSAALGVNVP